ncbi:uncharacterized protein LOC141684404 isoform X2 [Apium graveolens]|uniref:uncharacterized protein LOC141684404 isoform X2 n=1 Tax=Apium graveolens TaxID=4045 RepID=UPI003D79364A
MDEAGEELVVIPPAVNNIVGKLCAFQLKITPYNIIQGCEEYTVTRVSELNVVDSGTANLSHCTSAGNPVGPNSRKKQKLSIQRMLDFNFLCGSYTLVKLFEKMFRHNTW